MPISSARAYTTTVLSYLTPRLVRLSRPPLALPGRSLAPSPGPPRALPRALPALPLRPLRLLFLDRVARVGHAAFLVGGFCQVQMADGVDEAQRHHDWMVP